MSLEEFKAISPVFEEDIYEAISMKTCVDMRNTIGAPGKNAMEAVIRAERQYLKEQTCFIKNLRRVRLLQIEDTIEVIEASGS